MATVALEDALTELVRGAETLGVGAVDGAAQRALAAAIACDDAGRPRGAVLACAIELCLDLIAAGWLDPGVALPPLAMAASTLTASLRGDELRAGHALAASQYELETLFPLPTQRAPLANPRAPDVPLTALRRLAPAPSPAASSSPLAGRADARAARWSTLAAAASARLAADRAALAARAG